MDKIVVDTNIIFSLLRSGNLHTRKVFFDEKYTFYAPKFIVVELFEHKERIVEKAKISHEEVYELLDNLLQRIRFVDNRFISTFNYYKAFQLCKGIDENDTPFVALSLELNARFWTNDDTLKLGLISRGFDAFFDK